ncbi:MAG: hypothetical protein ACJARE_002164 [Paracoccaceae bacterium]|jgi:hypothetical protein
MAHAAHVHVPLFQIEPEAPVVLSRTGQGNGSHMADETVMIQDAPGEVGGHFHRWVSGVGELEHM